MNWDWHTILQWSGGVCSFIVVGVIVNSLYRENSKTNPAADDIIMIFFGIIATLILTVSTLLNFVIFVIR
jgi:nicotinamide riboside transporter PnuC